VGMPVPPYHASRQQDKLPFLRALTMQADPALRKRQSASTQAELEGLLRPPVGWIALLAGTYVICKESNAEQDK
jgi:hypothetical protein